MAHVRVEGFRAGNRQKNGAENQEPIPAVREQELQAQQGFNE